MMMDKSDAEAILKIAAKYLGSKPGSATTPVAIDVNGRKGDATVEDCSTAMEWAFSLTFGEYHVKFKRTVPVGR
jgi:hypothetical protein